MTTAAFLAKISPKRDFNGNHAYFFLFCDLIFIDIFDGFSGIHGYFRRIKLKTLGGIHETWKKNETSEAPRWARGPPLRPSGPAGCLRGFNLFFCQVSWNHPRFQFYPAKNIRETTETIKNINETRSQKKMRGFYLKLKTKTKEPYFLRKPPKVTK